MLGAIAGDIIGSRFEFHNLKNEEFEFFTEESHFTDDTVLTCATAEAILQKTAYEEKYCEYLNRYPRASCGASFVRWGCGKQKQPYNSYGNGSAMRVSPVAYAFDTLELVLAEAKKSAEVTHNHPEGIKGAQAVAGAIFLARTGATKEEIKSYIKGQFGYFLDFDLEELKKYYKYDITCQGTVPQAIFCFLISNHFEDAIRKAISIGGDSDTLGCITGSVAEAYYGGVPEPIKKEVFGRLDKHLLNLVTRWHEQYLIKKEKVL